MNVGNLCCEEQSHRNWDTVPVTLTPENRRIYSSFALVKDTLWPVGRTWSVAATTAQTFAAAIHRLDGPFNGIAEIWQRFEAANSSAGFLF